MQRRTVVLVEDDPTMEEVVLAIRDQFDGADVMVSRDVREAEMLVRDLRPALLVVDDDAPIHSGRELVRSLGSDTDTRDIPVVVLCGDGERGRSLVSSGAEAFLPKPFDIDDLLALVQFYAQAMPAKFARS